MLSKTVLSFLAATLLPNAAIALPNAVRDATASWQILPPTPTLPGPISEDYTDAEGGVKLWMQKYNEAAGGTPIVFNHGGLGYSAYFGAVIKQLVAAGNYVVAIDRRGHGRSTCSVSDRFSYDQSASDTDAHLRSAGITKYKMVGWSDGAATTLAMLMNESMAANIEKAFLFAGFQSAADTNTSFAGTPIYQQFVARAGTEYATLKPTDPVKFTEFALKVQAMEAELPQFTDEQLGAIDGAKVNIVGADHDEAVNLDVPMKLATAIPGSTLTMLKDVSHFAPVQDPTQFAKAVMAFLS